MKRISLAVLILVVFGACNPKQAKLRNAIDAKEKELMEDAKKGIADTAKVNLLLKDYEEYAEKYADDTISATYLFKAADFYRYMHKPLRSVELYSKIYERYPSSSRRPYALFLEGFIFENEAGNVNAAKALYEKFLKEYPAHPMAKDVKMTLDNLGKSPEEIIAGFEQKARQDSLAKAEIGR